MMAWWKNAAASTLAVTLSVVWLPCVAPAADLGGLKDGDPVEATPASSPWSFTFTTYGWMSWISGDVTLRGNRLSAEASPADLIDALDWSEIPIWMSYAEARNGRFGLFNDIIYTKLSDSEGFSITGPGGGVGVTGNVDVDYQQATIELGAAYEIWADRGYANATATALDVLAGGRYWHQKLAVTADAAFLVNGEVLGTLAVARSGSVDWVDPFIGARVRHKLAPGQEITARGDIGGFGAGSDFSWHILATYNLQLCLTDHYELSGYVGYKALSVDYSRGSGETRYEYDVLQHGPVLGATLRF